MRTVHQALPAKGYRSALFQLIYLPIIWIEPFDLSKSFIAEDNPLSVNALNVPTIASILVPLGITTSVTPALNKFAAKFWDPIKRSSIFPSSSKIFCLTSIRTGFCRAAKNISLETQNILFVGVILFQTVRKNPCVLLSRFTCSCHIFHLYKIISDAEYGNFRQLNKFWKIIHTLMLQ